MIKAIALRVYRGLYCGFLGVYLVGLLLRLPIGESLRPFEHPLFYALIGSISFAIFAAIAFSRIPEWLIWCATLVLSALFVWYGWFIRSFRNRSLSGTAIMLVFFLCLPVFHRWHAQRNAPA